MLFTTPTQYIALAIALIAGWLFGLASHPGGRKWKARYVAERDAHAVTTRRVSELERDNTRLASATPVVEERVVRDDRPVTEERIIREERPIAGDRVIRDDRPPARSAAAPAHPDDRRII